MKRSRRRYYNNPDWGNIIRSLLRLGDVSRNTQLGEVEAALEKAHALITKYNLSAFMAEYDRMLEKLQRFKRGEHVEATHTGSGSQQRSSYSSTRRQEREEAYKQWYQEWKRRKEEEFKRRWSGGSQTDDRASKERRERRSERTASRRETRAAWVKPPYDATITWTYAHWVEVGKYDRFPPRGFGGKAGWQRYQAAVRAKATTVRDAYRYVKWRDLRRWEVGRYIVITR